jgi:hypothetical protein
MTLTTQGFINNRNDIPSSELTFMSHFKGRTCVEATSEVKKLPPQLAIFPMNSLVRSLVLGHAINQSP